MIHVCIPYDTQKHLGVAYNQAIEIFHSRAKFHGGSNFIVVMDHDAMFLTPDAIKIIEGYTEKWPDTGIFTCYTNRLHPDSKGQLLGPMSENDSIRDWITVAEKQKSKGFHVTEINHSIGGFLMVINMGAWFRIGGFNPDKKCLGVDNDFSDRILKAGYKILRMDSIVVWHSYRLMNGYRDKKHLL